MIKTKAGERKRTVTVTLGPKTEAALRRWGSNMEASNPGQRWTLTDLVGVMLRANMRGRIASKQVDLTDGWFRMEE